jgi:hypothetical protein
VGVWVCGCIGFLVILVEHESLALCSLLSTLYSLLSTLYSLLSTLYSLLSQVSE